MSNYIYGSGLEDFFLDMKNMQVIKSTIFKMAKHMHPTSGGKWKGETERMQKEDQANMKSDSGKIVTNIFPVLVLLWSFLFLTACLLGSSSFPDVNFAMDFELVPVCLRTNPLVEYEFAYQIRAFNRMMTPDLV